MWFLGRKFSCHSEERKRCPVRPSGPVPQGERRREAAVPRSPLALAEAAWPRTVGLDAGLEDWSPGPCSFLSCCHSSVSY